MPINHRIDFNKYDSDFFSEAVGFSSESGLIRQAAEEVGSALLILIQDELYLDGHLGEGSDGNFEPLESSRKDNLEEIIRRSSRAFQRSLFLKREFFTPGEHPDPDTISKYGVTEIENKLRDALDEDLQAYKEN